MRCAALILLLLAGATAAEVKDSAPHGFTVEHSVFVSADATTAWTAATEQVGQWWSSSHTVAGDATRMTIDARPQGCFCETFDNGHGIVHMTVTFTNPGALIRLTGGLGPLGLMGVDGNMIWEFKPTEEGTEVRLTYAVGGYSPDGLDKIAPAVDFVLGEAMQRLSRFVETGSPEATEE